MPIGYRSVVIRYNKQRRKIWSRSKRCRYSKVRTKRVSTPVHPIIHPKASHEYVSTNGSTYDTSDIPNNDDGDDASDILHNNTIHIAILIGHFVFPPNHY